MVDRLGSPLYLFTRDIVQELNNELGFYTRRLQELSATRLLN